MTQQNQAPALSSSGQDAAQQTYTVHVYGVFRKPVRAIVATSPLEAIQKASDIVDFRARQEANRPTDENGLQWAEELVGYAVDTEPFAETGLSRSYDIDEGSIVDVTQKLSKKGMLGALRAIQARIKGEFDEPNLAAFGDLSENTTADVMAIAESALKPTLKHPVGSPAETAFTAIRLLKLLVAASTHPYLDSPASMDPAKADHRLALAIDDAKVFLAEYR